MHVREEHVSTELSERLLQNELVYRAQAMLSLRAKSRNYVLLIFQFQTIV